MRAVVQRVSRAEVRDTDDGTVLGRSGRGLCVLLGIGQGDGVTDAAWLADKILGLRIFPDPPGEGKPGNMNRSLLDVGGELLVVSQFTLYADTSKGRRPSFIGALMPGEAVPLYERFLELLRDSGRPVATGRFGAAMAVELVNDGPVTIWLDSIAARDKAPPPR